MLLNLEKVQRRLEKAMHNTSEASLQFVPAGPHGGRERGSHGMTDSGSSWVSWRIAIRQILVAMEFDGAASASSVDRMSLVWRPP